MAMMEVNESYRYIGVLASLTAWLAIAIVLWRWPRIKSQSISKHVAAYKQAWLIFAPLETVALMLFYVFMMEWFVPVLQLSAVFELLMVSALALELVTALVPDVPGIKHKIHHVTSHAAAYILPILVIQIALAPLTPLPAKIAAYVSFLVMISTFYIFMVAPTAKEKHLVYQSIYFACFHIPVLAVIFTV